MFKLHALVQENFNDLAALVTREHGKTLAESRAEVQRTLEMVEFAASIPAMSYGTTIPNIAAGVDAETNRHPVGVCVGITPYNFPNMVPMWMIPVAVVCGNTFVLKPSEKTPLSANRLGELILEAGFPGGVFNIVHGDKVCVDALLTHPDVAAISFVGSTPVAKYIYEMGTKHGKRVQSAGRAKNHLVVMPDADLDLAVKALAASAFGCGGQRCMAGSLAVAVGSIGDPLVEGLRDFAGSFNVGPSEGNEGVDMGPLIRKQHVERCGSYLDIANNEARRSHSTAAAILLAILFCLARRWLIKSNRPCESRRRKSLVPCWPSNAHPTSMRRVELGRNCRYGNGASIFTNSGYAAREFKRHFNAGMIGINVGVPAPMAWFPFTGWNQSFFGDLHIQGTESVHFYTKQKMTLTRLVQFGPRITRGSGLEV